MEAKAPRGRKPRQTKKGAGKAAEEALRAGEGSNAVEEPTVATATTRGTQLEEEAAAAGAPAKPPLSQRLTQSNKQLSQRGGGAPKEVGGEQGWAVGAGARVVNV